jgi:hypothetical protein
MSRSLALPTQYRAPIALDRRKRERVVTCRPISIFNVHDDLTSYTGVCTDLSSGGMGFDTDALLRVGQVVEFEFVQVADEAVRYSIQILARDGGHYACCWVDEEES